MAAGARVRSAVLLGVFALATFFGAGLLLEVQPLVGRVLLPQLGGTPGVWVTCLAFFQSALFLGYIAAHTLVRHVSPRAQVGLLLLLLGALLWRGPLVLPALVELERAASPAQALLVFLIRHVAPTCMMLSMTSPLLQSWYARISVSDPYPLYAVSNAGSMFGLLAYPLLIEPAFGLRAQQRAWPLAFAVYAALMALAALLTARLSAGPNAPAVAAAGTRAETSPREAASWIALSAAPGALLVAISSHITVDVPSTPQLWVAPLALYLASFTAAFARRAGQRRGELYAWLWIACTVALPILLLPGNQTRLSITLGVPLLTLWAGAMLCHGQLAQRRPDPSRLTAFFVCIAGGGALGGGVVAFGAPWLFADHYELVLSMMAIHVLQLAFSRRLVRSDAPSGAQRLAWIGFGLAVPVLIATLWVQVAGLGRNGAVLERTRNFFGPVRVIENARMRILTYGRTDQGQALRDPASRDEPVGYVGPDTAVGRALRVHARGRPRELGVLGLGVGALAAYAQAGDVLRFYEINPAMLDLAQRWFVFLSRTPAALHIGIGDGRLALAREPRHGFDVFVLDAFTSDAVPQHLLTREAFGVYLRQLAADGLLLVNVSNRHLSIERVVAGSARAHGLAWVVLDSAADPARGFLHSRWALLARRRELLGAVLDAPVRRVPVAAPVLWTDDHSSLLSIVR